MSVSNAKQIRRRSGHNSAVMSAIMCGADHAERNALARLTAFEISVSRCHKSRTPWLTALSAHSRHQMAPANLKQMYKKMRIFNTRKKILQFRQKGVALTVVADLVLPVLGTLRQT